MTQIPSGTKFVGISSSVPTPENRSSQNNAFQEVYTIDDIAESVGGGSETTAFIVLASEDGPIVLPKLEADINGRQAWKWEEDDHWLQISWNDDDGQWEVSDDITGVRYTIAESYTPSMISYPPLMAYWDEYGGDPASRFLTTNVVNPNTQTAVEDVAKADALTRLFLEGSSAYTETIVNISSAQILNMGTTPIELLPAPGVGKYYDIDKIVLEYTHVTTAYTLADVYLYTSVANMPNIVNYLIKHSYDVWMKLTVSTNTLEPNETVVYNAVDVTNQSVTLTTWNGTDPTDGDGTLRVKIYHKTITFGA